VNSESEVVEAVSVAVGSLVQEVVQSQHSLLSHPGETVRDAVSVAQLLEEVVVAVTVVDSAEVDELVAEVSELDVVLALVDEVSCRDALARPKEKDSVTYRGSRSWSLGSLS
jgi:CBS domain-containing protein